MSEFELDRSKYMVLNPHQPQSRTPYPFQEKAFAALDQVKQLNPVGFSTLLVLPTGAGKTYTAVHWIIRNYVNQGVKVLWIAHRSELLRQAAEAFYLDTTDKTLPDRDSFQTYTVSTEFGRFCKVPTANPDVVIASRQSSVSGENLAYLLKWAKGKGLKADRKLLIVLDEAHHAAARSYRTIIGSLKKYIPHVDILGLTATPYRTAKNEQGSLKAIFSTGSGIAYSIDANELIKAGILSVPVHTEISTGLDMTKVFSTEEIGRISKYDISSLDEKTLQKLTQNADRNRLIVDTYLKNQKKFGKTIVFAVDVANAIALNAMFRAAKVKSDYVVSTLVADMNRSVSTERNSQIIRAFKNGDIDVLVNVNIVTEGTDIPNIETVFLARPTTSRILMTQMIGRGLRGEAAGGTKETQIVYFVDEWRGLVDFVSPRTLMAGEDNVSDAKTSRRQQLVRYLRLSEIESYAMTLYERSPAANPHISNIIPYGFISCTYMVEDGDGNETEFTKEVLVFDECAEIYRRILAEIPQCVTPACSDFDLRRLSNELFFQYCESGSGDYIGVSGSLIYELMRTFLDSGEIPQLKLVSDRVNLSEYAKQIYDSSITDEELSRRINAIWENNAKVRMWYDKDYYIGMMGVYCSRLKKITLVSPEYTLPAKEDMDLNELKKHHPEYYNELREYVIQRTYRDEEGYYYSAKQDGPNSPYRAKSLHMFEIDHITPISKGGKSVKENLRLILWYQNREKGAKLE